MAPETLRARLLSTWVAPVAARVLALDPAIRAVVWALARDGDTVVDDFVPCDSEAPRWPDCADDNPWIEDAEGAGAELDEVLLDAVESLPCPVPEELEAAWGTSLPPGAPDHPEFVPVVLVTRAGARPWPR